MPQKKSGSWLLRLIVVMFIAALISLWLSSCASGPLTKREKGALIGGGGGALVGGLLGGGSTGALIGGGLGALGGGLMGDQLQRREDVDQEQWQELQRQQREIERQRRELERYQHHDRYKAY